MPGAGEAYLWDYSKSSPVVQSAYNFTTALKLGSWVSLDFHKTIAGGLERF